MAKFEGSRERKSKKSPRRDSRSRSSSSDKTFEDYSKGRSRKSSSRGRRDSGRGRRDDKPRRGSFGGRDSGRGRGRRDRDHEMTKVICSECGVECEVPFKPTSNKPVFCSECFEKKEKGSKGATSQDIEMIHEKLDKILKALKK